MESLNLKPLINIAVVGAGINGIASALRILETPFPFHNIKVTILAEQFSPNTTSDGAAGFIHQYLLGTLPEDTLRSWLEETFDYILNLILSPDASICGVGLHPTYELLEEPISDGEKAYKDIYLDFREMNEKELKMFPKKYKYGIYLNTIYAECAKLLPYMMKRIKEKGGKFVTKKINHLSELMDDYDVVINCSGVEAAYLVPDPETFPIRGQTIRVRAPWIKCGVITKHHYILINSDEIVCGGTCQKGDWNTNVDPKDRDFIWNGCCELVPSLKSAKIIKEWVGLRPGRHAPRLERETIRSTSSVNNNQLEVIHNYGHGGSGVTLFWGCAKDVVDHLNSILKEKFTISNSHL